MNEINCIKKDQSLIHATKTSSILESLLRTLQESGEDQEGRLLVIPILLVFGEITHFEERGGDFLIKVGTDVRRVQNLGRAQFPQKTVCLGKKVPKNLMTGQVFMTSRVPNLKIFSK